MEVERGMTFGTWMDYQTMRDRTRVTKRVHWKASGWRYSRGTKLLKGERDADVEPVSTRQESGLEEPLANIRGGANDNVNAKYAPCYIKILILCK